LIPDFPEKFGIIFKGFCPKYQDGEKFQQAPESAEESIFR